MTKQVMDPSLLEMPLYFLPPELQEMVVSLLPLAPRAGDSHVLQTNLNLNLAQALWEAFPDWRACLSTSLLYSNVSTIQLLNALHGLGWHGLAFQLLSSGVLTAFPIMMLLPIIIKWSKRCLIPTRRHMSRTLAPWHHLAEARALSRCCFSQFDHTEKNMISEYVKSPLEICIIISNFRTFHSGGGSQGLDRLGG